MSTSASEGRDGRVALLGIRTEDVSPLELFFDLVFVFAVSQLSSLLAADLGWQGAARTAVLLGAVFSIWAFSSFAVVFSSRERVAAVSIFAVLFLALFANAAIPEAFGEHPLLFVVPFLVCRVGQAVQAAIAAASPSLRRHHRAVLVWTGAETALWIVGAAAPPDARLGWWGAAAVVGVTGF